jgi:hypothetical protein
MSNFIKVVHSTRQELEVETSVSSNLKERTKAFVTVRTIPLNVQVLPVMKS